MKNDVFISYTTPDVAWAKKLHDDLTAQGLSVFFAPENIPLSQEWKDKFDAELAESQCIVVLWSDSTGNSDWVKHETNYFLGIQAASDKQQKRHVVPVWLQQSRYEVIQGINGMQFHGRAGFDFSKGASGIAADLWEELIRRILTEIEWTASDFVWSVVLAATKQEMENVALTYVPRQPGKMSFGCILRELQLLDPVQNTPLPGLYERYGDTREEWKPFFGSTTVRQALAQMRHEMIRKGGPQFLWKPVSSRLWGDNQEDRVDIYYLLETQPAVIVVDALSLYVNEVKSRFEEMENVFRNNKNAAVTILPPLATKPRDTLRDCVREVILPSYWMVYGRKLLPEPAPSARCDFLTPDEFEWQRMLIHTVQSSKETHWALQHQARPGTNA